MIHKLIWFIFTIILATVGISMYLQPNDLKSCNISPSVSGDCKVVDAIVVVSGGDTNARLNEAVKLYKNGWTKVLIFSGAALDKTGPSNAAVMNQIAINAGVPESSIYLDEYSETTKENAKSDIENFARSNARYIAKGI